MSKNYDGNSHTKSRNDDHANQSNPNNDAYKAAADNHANQCDPNDPEYKGNK